MKKNETYIKYVETAQEVNQEREDLKRMEEALPNPHIAEVIDEAFRIANACNDEIQNELERAGLSDEITIRVQMAGENHLATESKAKTRTRKEKKYVNPHTGEVVVTRGANHRVLKEWKAKWGSETVEGWVEK